MSRASARREVERAHYACGPLMLTIDPGVKHSAWALFSGAWLLSAGSDVSTAGIKRKHVSFVCVEKPEYQGARSARARVQDLVNLAYAAGRDAAYFGVRVLEIAPSVWKGSTPKPCTHLRALEVLTSVERRVLDTLGYPDVPGAVEIAVKRGARDRWSRPGGSYYSRLFPDDALDAIAMGLVLLGRM